MISTIPAERREERRDEVLRAYVVDGHLEVMLRRSFEEPDVWGIALADIARHAARIFAAETQISEAEALDKICRMFAAEMDHSTERGGSIQRVG